MPLRHVWLYPKGNGMFEWIGGESGQSWVSNCEISVKDSSATESIDYEALTADINGHRNLHIKVEIKDSHGLLSSPAIIVIRVVDENEPPYFVVDETRAQVDGEYGHSKQFAAMEMWRARHSRPFLNSCLLSFQITSSQVINFEAEEDTLISWTNRL